MKHKTMGVSNKILLRSMGSAFILTTVWFSCSLHSYEVSADEETRTMTVSRIYMRPDNQPHFEEPQVLTKDSVKIGFMSELTKATGVVS